MGTGYLHSCEFGIPYSLPKDPSYKHLTSRGKGARIRHEVYFWKHLAMVLGFTGRREASISQKKAHSIFNKKCKLTQETFPFTGWATEEWEYLFFFFPWGWTKVSENSLPEKSVRFIHLSPPQSSICCKTRWKNTYLLVVCIHLRCKSNAYLPNMYICKYLSSANIYLETKFLHWEDISYLSLYFLELVINAGLP